MIHFLRIKASFDKSARWLDGQKVPMIYICTTLWHEEDFEMATLIRSAIKLIDYAKTLREKASKCPDDTDAFFDYYNLEMHIFFDNVFDAEEVVQEDERPGWSGDAKKWKILNKWVVQFFDQLKKGLELFRQAEEVLQEGRVVLTPYGGRIEYVVNNTPLGSVKEPK